MKERDKRQKQRKGEYEAKAKVQVILYPFALFSLIAIDLDY